MNKERITLKQIFKEAEKTESAIQNGELLPPDISFNNIILYLEWLKERVALKIEILLAKEEPLHLPPNRENMIRFLGEILGKE